jgi:nucleotide-binding universal stress UspA family protein
MASIERVRSLGPTPTDVTGAITMTPPIVAGYCPQTADRGPITFAAAAARFTGAPLVVTSIHSGGAVVDHLAGGELADRPATETQQLLERLEAELGDGIDLHVRRREATTPAAGLAHALVDENAGLVVLGSTGRGPVGRVLPGSTAERVIHGAPCPVAVVPRGYELPDGGIATVGAAFAPTREGRDALRAAALVAEAAGARLRVVMVLDPKLAQHQAPGLLAHQHRDQGPGEDAAGRIRLEAERTLDEAIASLPDVGDVQRDVLFQDPADGLAAASEHLDLLVMGSRAYGPLRAVMLGGVSRRVITRAACPVLVLPRGTGSAIDGLLARTGSDSRPAGV